MGFKKIINSSINLAFAKLKDLAPYATYSKTTDAAFDFNTAAVVEGVSTTKPVKTVVLGIQQSGDAATGSRVMTSRIMFRKSDIDNVGIYDTVVINSQTWKLGTVVQDTGYVIMVDVSRSL